MITDWLPTELKSELMLQQHKATGAAINSIRCERVKDGYTVTGLGYLYWNQYKRRPGVMPPLDAIRRWVQVKGLPVAAVWPIALKLKRQGSGKPFTMWKAGNSLNREDFIGRTIEKNRERLNAEIGQEWHDVIFEKWIEETKRNKEQEIQI